MRKLFIILSVLISFASAAQNKIVITSNALNRQDSTIYVTQYQNDTGKITLRTSIAGKLNISDTAAMLSPYLRKIDTTGKWVNYFYRKAATDSVFYVKNGTATFAFKDSTGGSGGVASVTASSPLASSGGSTPNITIQVANASQNGYATTNQITSSLGCTVDGQGGVVSTGSKGFVTIPYACTITNWYVSADVSGSIQFDIKRSGTSIVGGGGNKPLLSSAISGNAAASGWTSTSVSAGDILEWVVDNATTVTNVTVVLKVIK